MEHRARRLSRSELKCKTGLCMAAQVTVRHHDNASYYCVECTNEKCKELIPLLEYDPKKQRKNPPEFKAKCPVCGHANLYDDIWLQVSMVRRVEGFAAAWGFRNVEASTEIRCENRAPRINL
jgi:hypothetical protein